MQKIEKKKERADSIKAFWRYIMLALRYIYVYIISGSSNVQVLDMQRTT